MSAISSNQPLTNVQLEILKAFRHHLNDADLKTFRVALARYFADRAIVAANRTWDEKGWDEERVNQLLNTKLRASK